MLEEFVASPRRSLDRLCEVLEAFYEGVMEPLMGTIDARLRSDVKMREGLLRVHGLAAVLRTLTPQLAVERENARQCAIRFGGLDVVRTLTEHSSLTLVPSYFASPQMQAFLLQREDGGLDCTIVYPLPALPPGTQGISNRKGATRLLRALGETSRLRIIEMLAQRDLSTRELAGFLRTSEPVVSRHLRVLYEAGAVNRRRDSYFVLYSLRREALQELRDVLNGLST
jgi:DNA-binding transcriptional ArsR family regulator